MLDLQIELTTNLHSSFDVEINYIIGAKSPNIEYAVTWNTIQLMLIKADPHIAKN